MTVTINGTTGIAGANGSASTPAVQGEDTNTGVFFPAADTIAFAEGGAEVARFDSSGNFGVGRTTIQASGGSSIEASGALFVGGPISSHQTSRGVFQFNGNETSIRSYGATAGSGQIVFTQGGGGSADTERARIDASGNMSIGVASPSPDTRLQAAITGSNHAALFDNDNVNTYATMLVRNRAASGTRRLIDFRDTTGVTIGSVTYNGSATSYTTSSDYRLKENVQPMQDALAVIAQLNPVTYTWKADGSDGQGFIAHELQAVVPDCVTGEKDAVDAEGNPQYQGVDTSFLVATLVKAVQELTARIAALEAAQ
jgi:hypothetical protein